LFKAPSFKGIPDVAAQSDRYRIFLSGVPRLIGGTSASSPAFAGIVALLNDVRLSKKQPPLGFLNPLLYSKGLRGFNDITIGHNSGCGTIGFNVCLSSFGEKRVKLIAMIV
jgi:tripeptidyl-peptidase-1